MSLTDGNLETLEKHREVLIVYSQMKLDTADWHALSDSANDLREIEAAIAVLRRVDGQRVDS